MGTSAPSRARLVAFKATMVLASTLVALVFAEVALRIVTPPKKEFMVWPANMYHVFRPNPEVMPMHSAESHFSSSSRGLRGPETGPDTEARILAIGGSTTECLYIDEVSAWPLRVGKLLSTEAKHVWSASAGLSGMNSSDHVIHAKFLVPQLPRIDIVIGLMGVNDLVVALGAPETYRAVPGDVSELTSEALLRRAFQQVPGRLENSWDYDAPAYRKTALYQLLRRIKIGRSRDLAAANIATDDGGLGMTRWRQNRQAATEIIDALPDLTEALATYRKNLNTFIDVLGSRKVRVILMTQPTLWRADLPAKDQKLLWMGGKGNFQAKQGLPYYSVSALAEGMVKFNDVMLSVCKERSVDCVDLATMIPKDTDHFYDDCHFGFKTSEKMADIVAEAVKKGRPFTP
jgi:hypothetical protein